MSASLSDERLAKIRERAESVKTWKAAFPEPVPQICDVDVPALLAEVARLRSELAERRAMTLPLKEAIAAAGDEQDQTKREMTQLHMNREQSRWVAGEMEKHRDAYKADLDRLTGGLRTLIARCEQGARDNGEYYERTAAKYEYGKAVVWDAVATELRALYESTTDTAGGAT